MIFVDRKEMMRSVKNLRAVGDLIRKGKSVIAFPEGTRNRGGPILPFKKGVFAAAIAAGVPVVPVAIDGAGKMMPPNSWRIRPGVIRLAIGRPMPTAHLTDYDRDILPDLVREAIVELKKTIAD
jgi:1-acyl-sn-glycerol-3-phosphate acyltransferase